MIRTLILCFLIFSANVAAEEGRAFYQAGEMLAPVELTDQHDKVHVLGPEVKTVLFTTGMKGGAVVRDVLDEQQADYLASNQAMFISDISGMPKIIAGMIALPRMRSHDYPIVLDRDGSVTSRFPSRENSATIMHLDRQTITSIEFTQDSQDVVNAIESR